MSPMDVIKYPLDLYRTAPFGLTCGTICAWAGVEAVDGYIESPSTLEAISVSELALGAIIGGALAVRQFRQRARIKETVEKYGYVPRMMSKTTKQWCSRQTVRTVLRRTGHLDEYDQLCEENKDSNELSWLPHF